MDLFRKKPTLKEQTRENEKSIRRATRDVERDRRGLERDEKKLEAEIRAAAKAGNKQACGVLAKQLIQLRKQKSRTVATSGRIAAAGYSTKAAAANVRLAEAMDQTAKTMGLVNGAMDTQAVAKTARDFEMANAKMEMSEETMNEALDDILQDSGDEEEEKAVIDRVLDEIGIEISGKMINAPSAHKGTVGEASKARNDDDKDIEAMLAQLKS